MGAIRADAAKRQRAARCRARGARARAVGRPRPIAALRALLDLYAGSSSRYLNFYGPARAIRTVPYDRALTGSSEIDLAGKVVLVGDVRAAAAAAAGRLLFGVLREHRHQSERCRGRRDRARRTCSSIARCSRCRCRFTLRWSSLLGVAFGSVIGRLHDGARGRCRRCASLRVYFAVAFWQFTSYYVWLPLVVPLLVQLPAGLRCGRLVELSRGRRAARTRTNRARVLRAEVACAAVDASRPCLCGANRELLHGTCLVTDAEHYTSVAETLAPADARCADERLLPRDLSRGANSTAARSPTPQVTR